MISRLKNKEARGRKLKSTAYKLKETIKKLTDKALLFEHFYTFVISD